MYQWRGMMLDVSRYFFDKEYVIRYMEMMAVHKLNTLHLHVVDDPGWRVQIDKYPKLTEIGGFRGKGPDTYGGYYTKDDIRQIVEYANKLHIYDTHLMLILVNSMASIPFVVWIMKGFIEEIPYAIEEAAQVDGASWFQVIKDHVMPLGAPGLVAVSLFVVIYTWNEFLFATILTGRYVLPFPKAVPGLTYGVNEPHWAAVSALGMMVVIPIVLLSFYMQKYIVRGMSYGAIRE